jgi:hypothetical protein
MGRRSQPSLISMTVALSSSLINPFTVADGWTALRDIREGLNVRGTLVQRHDQRSLKLGFVASTAGVR